LKQFSAGNEQLAAQRPAGFEFAVLDEAINAEIMHSEQIGSFLHRVGKPRSRYQFQALKKAVEEAGPLFDPKSSLEPDTPYLQLVEPGVAEIGKFEKPEVLEQFQALTLERPTMCVCAF
jgi:hypothetical protein